jgi:hypothetical protein
VESVGQYRHMGSESPPRPCASPHVRDPKTPCDPPPTPLGKCVLDPKTTRLLDGVRKAIRARGRSAITEKAYVLRASMKCVALTMVMLVGVSCTRTVQVAVTDSGRVNPDDAKNWRVTTKGQETYSVTKFSMTDTTLVIERVLKTDEIATDYSDFTHVEDADLPLVLPLDEIESLERVAIHRGRTTAWVVAGFTGFAVLAFVLVVGYGLSQIN